METIKQIEIPIRMEFYKPIRMEFYKLTGVSFESYTWDKLIGIVEFIENIQKSDKYYTWEEANDKGILETHSNFNGYTVEIVGNCCFMDVQLELDPPKSICRKIRENKFEAVLDACYEFALKYNNNEL
jgi:hypothetical protein